MLTAAYRAIAEYEELDRLMSEHGDNGPGTEAQRRKCTVALNDIEEEEETAACTQCGAELGYNDPDGDLCRSCAEDGETEEETA